MPYVNNNMYLELAKLDYNHCQALHQSEWNSVQKWFTQCKLGNFGTNRRALLLAYFLASASLYEPERSQERIAWAKTAVLVETITSYFHNEKDSINQRRAFVHEFGKCINARNRMNRRDTHNLFQLLTRTLLGTLNHLSLDALAAQGRDVSLRLHQAWEKWLMKWQMEGDRHQGEAELLVQTVNLVAGHWFSGELSPHPQYRLLSDLTNRICHKLGHYHIQKVRENGNSITKVQIESDMQELVRLVLQNSANGLHSNVKQTFLTIAKSFYYVAYCDTETINFHVNKVLFKKVD